MTTKRGENVNAIEVKECERGCDDIDDVCSKIFADEEFVQRNGITSLNSCNILRILAQLPHFFWCYFRTMHGKTTEEEIENHTMTCVVPTGADGTRVHRSASSRDGFAHDGSGVGDQRERSCARDCDDW